jgi:hypothetical protein
MRHALAFVLVAAACGGGEKPAPAPKPQPVAAAEPTPTPPAEPAPPPVEPTPATPQDDPPPPEPVGVNDDDDIYGGLVGNEVGQPIDSKGATGRSAEVKLGTGKTTGGDLDKAIIARYMRRNLQKFSYCYEKQLLVDSKLAGKLTAKFTIGTNGNVETSEASGVDPAVSECYAAVIKAIEFPKPKDGTAVAVTYPFTMKPKK